LRAIAYGWRQEALAENAEEIRKLGEELYSRLGTLAGHLSKLGKDLDHRIVQLQLYSRFPGESGTARRPPISCHGDRRQRDSFEYTTN
jgi:hypothetical protein